MLVNDIWGAEVLKGGPASGTRRSGSTTSTRACASCGSAIDTHLITSHHLLPLLVDRPGGLLVEVTDGTADYNATHYRISVFYDLAKVAVNRLAFSQGHELAPHGGDRGGDHARVAALRDDARELRRHRGATGATPLDRRRRRRPRRPASRSPSRRATSGARVAALAADPERARWNQQSVSSGQLAREYGFTDVDGSQPDVWRLRRRRRGR